ncbi:E3 ubiquitin protein ligase SINAT2 [Tanacetum coccineum]
MGSIICLALEKLAEPLKVPYNCPYSGSQCSVTGNIPELVTHLTDCHNVYMRNDAELTHYYAQSHEDDNVTGMLGIFNCHGRQFCYHFDYFLLNSSPCYIAFIRFMGDDNDAQNFRYSLEVIGNSRKLSWQGVPSSIRRSHEKIRDNLDGLAISPSMALLFSDENKKGLNLLVKGRIWME